MFFMVMWRGVCQALEWFFGLFGYKRDGKFAKCVWGVFSSSIALIAACCAILMICVVCSALYTEYCDRYIGCDDPHCYKTQFVGRHLYFHNHEDGKGYIFNTITGEKTLKHIAWIAKPTTVKDSLVCFSDGKKRGYLSRNTGKAVIKPKYDHAWIFSGGIASVEEGGRIKFIDETGKVVIDKDIAYNPRRDGYVFHGDYCIIYDNHEELCGLMDRKGNIVLPMEYDKINITTDLEFWCLRKDEQMAVIDKNLKTIIPMTECSISIYKGIIRMTMADHTIRKYDMDGNLINDFYILDIRTLAYEKDEIARLRAYVAGDNYEGLMTAEGHIVTMPLYKNIEAIGNDLYLCASANEDKVIVNGKGEIVK